MSQKPNVIVFGPCDPHTRANRPICLILLSRRLKHPQSGPSLLFGSAAGRTPCQCQQIDIDRTHTHLLTPSRPPASTNRRQVFHLSSHYVSPTNPTSACACSSSLIWSLPQVTSGPNSKRSLRIRSSSISKRTSPLRVRRLESALCQRKSRFSPTSSHRRFNL
jgi:hypothetical protein